MALNSEGVVALLLLLLDLVVELRYLAHLLCQVRIVLVLVRRRELVQVDVSSVEERVWSVWSLLFTEVTQLLVRAVVPLGHASRLVNLAVWVVAESVILELISLHRHEFWDLGATSVEVDSLRLQVLFRQLELVLSNLEMVCCSQEMLEIDLGLDIKRIASSLINHLHFFAFDRLLALDLLLGNQEGVLD